MAERGLNEILDGTSVKRLIKAVRSIIYPLKDNLRTLDDNICLKTLYVCQRIVRKSDKLAVAFVPHFHILLPSVEVLKNKHSSGVGSRQRSVYSAVHEGRWAGAERKGAKLTQLKGKGVDMGALIQ